MAGFGVGVSPGVSPVLQLPGAAGPLLGGSGLVEANFRLLVPEKQTGSIIGKGGEVQTVPPQYMLEFGHLTLII